MIAGTGKHDQGWEIDTHFSLQVYTQIQKNNTHKETDRHTETHNRHVHKEEQTYIYIK